MTNAASRIARNQCAAGFADRVVSCRQQGALCTRSLAECASFKRKRRTGGRNSHAAEGGRPTAGTAGKVRSFQVPLSALAGRRSGGGAGAGGGGGDGGARQAELTDIEFGYEDELGEGSSEETGFEGGTGYEDLSDEETEERGTGEEGTGERGAEEEGTDDDAFEDATEDGTDDDGTEDGTEDGTDDEGTEDGTDDEGTEDGTDDEGTEDGTDEEATEEAPVCPASQHLAETCGAPGEELDAVRTNEEEESEEEESYEDALDGSEDGSDEDGSDEDGDDADGSEEDDDDDNDESEDDASVERL